MLIKSIDVFSQDCPCVKTAIIGTNTKVPIVHNNKLVAMDNVTINLGESVNLYIKESTGENTWYKDGNLIENTLVSPKETTEYTVKSTLDGCPELIAKIQIKVNKSLSENLNNSVNVYPNSADNYMVISSKSKRIKNIKIYNLIGEKIETFECGNDINYQMLNISNLTIGIYIVMIELEGNSTIVKKLVKN